MGKRHKWKLERDRQTVCSQRIIVWQPTDDWYKTDSKHDQQPSKKEIPLSYAKGSIYSDFIDEGKSYSVDVYASQASGSDYYDENGELVEGDIIVWLPTEATLEEQTSGEYKCTVQVKVQGNIAGNEKVCVVPDSTVTLTQPGKADVTGTVTQLKTDFTYEDLKDGTIAQTTTEISASELSAGEWTGSYSYAVSLVEF